MTESVLIIFTAFCGFLLASYIWRKKRGGEKLVCPMKASCDEVIHSDYSRFFGIKVELLGMLYYVAIAIGYGVKISFGSDIPLLEYVLVASTMGAFLFSVYLTFVQIFALRAFCSWCLISAGLCTVIFLLAAALTFENVALFLSTQQDVLFTLHLIAVALGVGSATMANVFFIKFLKDFRISNLEADVLKIAWQIVWLAIGGIIITGIGLYLPNMEEQRISPIFQSSVLVLGVIMLNAAALNLFITPRLMRISFGQERHHKTRELHNIRSLTFSLGPVALVSWYSLLVLVTIDSWDISFVSLTAAYALFLAAAVIIGYVFERKLNNRAKNTIN